MRNAVNGLHLSASTVNQTSKQQAWLSLRVFSTIVSQSQQIRPSLAPALRWDGWRWEIFVMLN